MTFGKQRAPTAMEQPQCICYRAQAAHLILDHRNEIDTISTTLNGLICHRSPQRNVWFQTALFKPIKCYRKEEPFFQLFSL